MKTMIDNNGFAIPVNRVSAYDKRRDQKVRRVLARFIKARASLEQLVSESIVDINDVAQLREDLGEKGNFSATSFDGLCRVSIRQLYRIELDERVARARELMLAYVDGVLSRVQGSDAAALRLIVDEAFRSNALGVLSVSRILALLRMEIDDANWREAKELLKASLRPQKGKRYLRCEIRPNVQAEFRQIRLDIADCWPSEEVRHD